MSEVTRILDAFAQGEDQVVNIRDVRSLMLYKLHADDEQPETLMQKLDKVEDYLSFSIEHDELKKYNEAKNLIGAVTGGNTDRNKGILGGAAVVLKDVKTEDVEEKKEKLLAQVEAMLKRPEFEAREAREKLEKAKGYLQPRPIEKEDRVPRRIF
jgi:hypothetical protein